MDVLDEEVYTWRAGSAARGLSADTDPGGLLAEVDALAQLAADAPEAVRRRLVVGRLSQDLVRLAEVAHREGPDFAGRLRRTARRALADADDLVWEAVGLLDRLVYLHYGLAVILGFIGFKLIVHALHTNEVPFINGGREWHAIPEASIGVSLSVIITTVLVTVIASVLKSRADARRLEAAS